MSPSFNLTVVFARECAVDAVGRRHGRAAHRRGLIGIAQLRHERDVGLRCDRPSSLRRDIARDRQADGHLHGEGVFKRISEGVLAVDLGLEVIRLGVDGTQAHVRHDVEDAQRFAKTSARMPA